MVLRLEGWLGFENGGRADVWIGQQAATIFGKFAKQVHSRQARCTRGGLIDL